MFRSDRTRRGRFANPVPPHQRIRPVRLVPYLPTTIDIELSSAALGALAHANLTGRDRVRIWIEGPDGPMEAILPVKAMQCLRQIVRYIADRRAVAVLPYYAALSTQQVAELLSVSRPHVVKLLERGEIPFHRTGKHRRILLDDVLSYLRQR